MVVVLVLKSVPRMSDVTLEPQRKAKQQGQKSERERKEVGTIRKRSRVVVGVSTRPSARR